MRLAFKKLFESGPDSAKTSQHSAVIQEVESKTASAAEGDALWQQGRDEDSALKYEKVSCNFDSIGQRNETLRAQLETNFERLQALARTWQAVALERHPNLRRAIEEDGGPLVDLSPLRLTPATVTA